MDDREGSMKVSETDISRSGDAGKEKAIVPYEEVAATVEFEKSGGEIKPDGSRDRDVVLAKIATEKRLGLTQAWVENEKSKVDNKAQKKLSAIGAWENSKIAQLDAELKKIEEEMEKRRAESIEKMQNKVALLHKEAEEKRTAVEAKRGEDILKAEETAAKYRTTGTVRTKKLFGIFKT